MTARVLVVDDRAANLKLLEARLTAEYFEVITCDNGPDAIEICKQDQCDDGPKRALLVVVDSGEMPKHGEIWGGEVDRHLDMALALRAVFFE